MMYAIISAVVGLLCCGCAALFLFLIIGVMLLRKKGKKKITPKEGVIAGFEQVSRAFVRTNKTREQLMAEEEEEERKNGPR